MTDDDEKREAARAALKYVRQGEVLGVGTGSTVNAFIEALTQARLDIPAAVASSEETRGRLDAAGIPVRELNDTGPLQVYVDGADEATAHLQLIKGGGGALAREKVLAGASRQFVCIASARKLVKVLGGFPLPIEVLPMARSHVARQLVALGGQPQLRDGFTTDNGNQILDVRGLSIVDPPAMEAQLGAIAGVVCVGLFARRPADVLLLAGPDGVQTLRRSRP